MSTQILNLTPELQHYLLAKSLREPAVLRELRISTLQLPAAKMQIAPEQGQLIQLLLKLIGARKTLEIGVFTGYSTLCAALALPEDGEIVACDINFAWTAIAQTFWQQAGVAHKITLRIAPALTTLDALIDQAQAGTFDFAFIDADKANYLNYYERCLRLLRPGGLLAIDNVLWYGAVADPTQQTAITCAIRALNDHIHQDQRVSMSMVPIGDGLTLVRKH